MYGQKKLQHLTSRLFTIYWKQYKMDADFLQKAKRNS